MSPFAPGETRPVLPFSTRLEHQLQTYTETTIWGDLSESDNAAAMRQYSSYTVSLPLFLVSNWTTPPRRAQTALGTWTLAALTD